MKLMNIICVYDVMYSESVFTVFLTRENTPCPLIRYIKSLRSIFIQTKILILFFNPCVMRVRIIIIVMTSILEGLNRLYILFFGCVSENNAVDPYRMKENFVNKKLFYC